jgi:hypothetical protein
MHLHSVSFFVLDELLLVCLVDDRLTSLLARTHHHLNLNNISEFVRNSAI